MAKQVGKQNKAAQKKAAPKPQVAKKSAKAPAKAQKKAAKPQNKKIEKPVKAQKVQQKKSKQEEKKEIEEEKKEVEVKQEKNQPKKDNLKKTIVKEKSAVKVQAKKAKLARFEAANQVKANPETNKCIIYVGHLPHGLLEDQLKQYFAQYGTIKAVKVGRSRKTARSKGFGFVQFEIPEIADIAAKAMNNYMILGKILDVHVLTKEQPNPFSFKSGQKQYKFINWSKIFAKEKNQEKSEEKMKQEVQNLLKQEEKKRQQLKDLGIEYQFPGYKSQVTVESTPAKKQEKAATSTQKKTEAAKTQDKKQPKNKKK